MSAVQLQTMTILARERQLELNIENLLERVSFHVFTCKRCAAKIWLVHCKYPALSPDAEEIVPFEYDGSSHLGRCKGKS